VRLPLSLLVEQGTKLIALSKDLRPVVPNGGDLGTQILLPHPRGAIKDRKHAPSAQGQDTKQGAEHPVSHHLSLRN
jgi:hypothetical protein